jgi:hypothetical protein
MACVTLKRPLDFDPLETLHSPDRPPTKRRRCTPIKNVDRESANLRCQTSMEPSPFRESPLSPSEVANYLRDELKRLRKRRQIVTSDSATVTAAGAPRSPPASPGSPEPMVEGQHQQQGHHVYQEQLQRATSLMIANTGGVLATANLAITPPRPTTATSPAASTSSSVAANNKKTDRPVFTLKQMTMICEKMCQERTDQVREEYDRILQQKLSEQYDAFVKFIDHQIQQRFNQSQLPSYLS